mgnify:CR=1 FL=1
MWHGKAVTVRHGAFRLSKFRLGGHGAFRLGLVRFGWARSGKAVVDWRGMVSRGRARQGGHGALGQVLLSSVKAS